MSKSMNDPMIIRQGDVLLAAVSALPAGCTEIAPTTDGKLVLALGEATGHHHRIENVVAVGPQAAAEIADAAIARAIVLGGEWLQWLDDRSIPLCDVRLREPHGYETLPLDHLLARALSAAARAPWVAGDLSILGERLIEWLATHEDVRAQAHTEVDSESLQEP